MNRFVIEGVFFSTPGEFPSEVNRCMEIFSDGDELKNWWPIQRSLLQQQLAKMELEYNGQSVAGWEALPSPARKKVEEFLDFVSEWSPVLASHPDYDICQRFPNSGDAEFLDDDAAREPLPGGTKLSVKNARLLVYFIFFVSLLAVLGIIFRRFLIWLF